MEITIFNPKLDTDGKVLDRFLDMLTGAFQKNEKVMQMEDSDDSQRRFQ